MSPIKRKVDNMSKNLPALAKLTGAQAAYVVAFVENGGKGGEAARTAGYAEPRQESWRLQQNPEIMRAIFDLQKQEFSKLSGKALSFLSGVLDQGQKRLAAGEKISAVYVDAAKTVLDRAGHVSKNKEKQEDKTPGIGDMTKDELREFIERGQRRLSDEIEATAVDVTPDRGDSAQPGAQRSLQAIDIEG